MPAGDWLEWLAGEFKYKGYSKHKLNPHAYELEAFRGDREDATFCDGHAKFPPERMGELPELFRNGIKAGLTGSRLNVHNEPTIVWCIDKNGWIYEGRITVASQAIYHGYPVRPGEAIAQEVIRRYLVYAEQNRIPAGIQKGRQAQSLYR
jgi:hypothetical protein